MPAEQVLRIEPEHELKFKGPFNVPSTTVMKLTNPSEKRVCFKIKTTAPKRYCVRPNAGLLEPGQQASIAVIFQPCELEPTANKHKFMVQSLYVPEGEANWDALWKDADTSIIMDTKLRCTFEMPGGEAATQNDLNAADEKITRAKNSEDVFVASRAQKGDAEAAAQDSNVQSFVDSSAFVSSYSTSEDNRGVGDASGRVQQEVSQLKNENSHLKDELDRLKRQLKSREASGAMGMAMPNASPPAIPMVYIVLALIAVLIGLILGKFVL